MEKIWQIEFVPNQTTPIKAEFKENTGYRLEIASPDVLGGVRPCRKTEEMTQPVGVDADGALWTENRANVDLTGYATEEFVNKKIAEAELGGEEVDLSSYAQKSELPTKVSQLENDKGYLTEHQDISGKLDASALPTAIDTALAQAKKSGEFKGDPGETGPQGEQGPQGISGVYVGSGEMPEGYNVQIDPNGSVADVGSSENAVLYTEQTLTEEQKAQARENIGAVDIKIVEKIVDTALGVIENGTY